MLAYENVHMHGRATMYDQVVHVFNIGLYLTLYQRDCNAVNCRPVLHLAAAHNDRAEQVGPPQILVSCLHRKSTM